MEGAVPAEPRVETHGRSCGVWVGLFHHGKTRKNDRLTVALFACGDLGRARLPPSRGIVFREGEAPAEPRDRNSGRARLPPSRGIISREGEAPAEPCDRNLGRARLPPSRVIQWRGRCFGSAGASPSQGVFGSAGASPSQGVFRLSRSFALPKGCLAQQELRPPNGCSAQQELRPPNGCSAQRELRPPKGVFRLSGSFALPKGCLGSAWTTLCQHPSPQVSGFLTACQVGFARSIPSGPVGPDCFLPVMTHD